jgi:CRISPR-associated protein Cas6
MSEMTEIVYDLKSSMLPGDYAFALWRELVRVLPWLEVEERAGVLPLRGSHSGGMLLVPQRAKLMLRMPEERAQQARTLSGQTLDVEGHALEVGAARERPLLAHPSLHAHLVVSAAGESEFLQEMEAHLREMDISCKLICGKRVELRGGADIISGYSLVVYELKPEGSLHLQQAGLGGERRYGCGLFIPCKDIPSLD